tara:strand:- start:1025 stop:1303 length:279 start_codon:yes stop_codon:yes gene_type:complete
MLLQITREQALPHHLVSKGCRDIPVMGRVKDHGQVPDIKLGRTCHLLLLSMTLKHSPPSVQSLLKVARSIMEREEVMGTATRRMPCPALSPR